MKNTTDPVPQALAMANGWSELSPEQKNNLVGETLRMKPLTQCWFGYEGKKLLRTPWTEEQRKEPEALARMSQTDDELWASWLVAQPSLQPEMRGKVTVEIDRWHLRYSDTPGGGWMVIEWLHGKGTVRIETVADQWRVCFDDGNPHHGRYIEAAPTDGRGGVSCLVSDMPLGGPTTR